MWYVRRVLLVESVGDLFGVGFKFAVEPDRFILQFLLAVVQRLDSAPYFIQSSVAVEGRKVFPPFAAFVITNSLADVVVQICYPWIVWILRSKSVSLICESGCFLWEVGTNFRYPAHGDVVLRRSGDNTAKFFLTLVYICRWW